MARKHGITTNTYKKFIIDSGAVYKNYGISTWTVTLDTVIATDAVVINGVTYTCVAADPGALEFLKGATDTDTAVNLAAKLTTITDIDATSALAVVVVVGATKAKNILMTTPDTTITLVHNGMNSTLLGATRGGSTFTEEQELREMIVDGSKGRVVGDCRPTKSIPKITANFVEISADLINYAIPGSNKTDYPSTEGKTHDLITRALDIAITDYLTNVAIVGECTGSPTNYIECIINNAIAEGNYEIAFTDNDESLLKLTFYGNFTTADLTTEPFSIYYPIISA